MKKNIFLFAVLLAFCCENAVFCRDNNVDESLTRLLDLYKKTQMQEQQCMQQLDDTTEFLEVQKVQGISGACFGGLLGFVLDVLLANCIPPKQLDRIDPKMLAAVALSLIAAGGCAGYKWFVSNYDNIRTRALLEKLKKKRSDQKIPFPRTVFWNNKAYSV